MLGLAPLPQATTDSNGCHRATQSPPTNIASPHANQISLLARKKTTFVISSGQPKQLVGTRLNTCRSTSNNGFILAAIRRLLGLNTTALVWVWHSRGFRIKKPTRDRAAVSEAESTISLGRAVWTGVIPFDLVMTKVRPGSGCQALGRDWGSGDRDCSAIASARHNFTTSA